MSGQSNTSSATTTSPRTSRALLGAGLGALAATVAGARGRPREVSAAHGDVHLGANNTATLTTQITYTTNRNAAFRGEGASAIGLFSYSSPDVGVFGYGGSK
jgi:hypothetical protein